MECSAGIGGCREDWNKLKEKELGGFGSGGCGC